MPGFYFTSPTFKQRLLALFSLVLIAIPILLMELSCHASLMAIRYQCKSVILRKKFTSAHLCCPWPLADTNPSHYNTICFLFMTCKYNRGLRKKKKIKLVKPEFVILGNSLLHIHAAWQGIEGILYNGFCYSYFYI